MKKILVTGSAGFVGFHVALQFLEEGWEVHGIDALTDYYDVKLKMARNAILEEKSNFHFWHFNLEERLRLDDVFRNLRPNIVIHLAAQAGVRYSIDNPSSYVTSNLVSSFNLLEVIKKYGCEHLLLASTSSVYGSNSEQPYKEIDKADTQMSFYAATKKAMESMSHSYSHLFDIPMTCFRFFTAYGPWGRPDMALFKFVKLIKEDKEIDVYNGGKMIRDFTYIDDLTTAIFKLTFVRPSKDESKKIQFDSKSPVAPWRVVNIGSGMPRKLTDLITIIEKSLQKTPKINLTSIQAGDVLSTFADVSLLNSLTGFSPKTNLETGVENFVKWYEEYN